MKYYKNTELADLYHVSEKAVRNWIESTNSGKLDLELFTIKGRQYIANTTKNLHIIEGLVEKGKKFKNSRGHKVVSPKPEFYELYTNKQILDIMTNIDTDHEIPLQYSYFNGGALYWKAYIKKLLKESKPNMLTSTMKLIETSTEYIDELTSNKKVNLVDLCIGEGTPAMQLVKHLKQNGQLHRYVGVDFSKDMLTIAHDNVEEFFNGEVKLETHIRDLNYDRIEDVLRTDSFNIDGAPINLVMLLGGTLTNCKDPDLALRMINASLGRDDYLVYGLKLDTESSRRYFDFHLDLDGRPLAPNHELVLNLLNIDPEMYTVEQFFDEKQRARFIRIRMKTDVSIIFELDGAEKRIVIPKNDSILVWRYWHQTALDVINQFDQKGFDLLHASLTENKEYLLTVSRVKGV